MARSSVVAGSLGSALALVARASQPGAAQPVAAPMRDLPWGQLNFLHTTDSHGWLGGHLQEPQYSADWGDYVSFAQHMRKRSDDAGSDFILVDTGDRIEGNGLYDASVPKGLYQYDIFAQQPIDVLCVGNHELYQAYSADREHNTTVPHYKDAYIASNLDYIDAATGRRQPLAPRYRKFTTKNLNLTVVALGFLFDFVGNANNTVVQPVAEAIKEPWFQQAVHEKPHLFLVAGHVGLHMPEFRTIFTALRKHNWHVPIVFFGGHVHARDALAFDSRSLALVSGRYLETIGWMSVSGFKTRPPSAPASVSFNRKYIDNNLFGMYYHTGLNETTFPTEQGKHTSKLITDARRALRLDERLGCAPRDLWTNRAPYPSDGSIYSWIADQVLPDLVVNVSRRDKPRLALVNTGGIRFDLFKGPVTRDSLFAISPFNNSLAFVPDVPYAIAQRVLGILNSADKVLTTTAANPDLRLLDPSYPRHADGVNDEVPRLELRRRHRRSSSRDPVAAAAPDLVVGYTTHDDLGRDGDDTVHRPFSAHAVPNCFEARIRFPADGADPPAVDVVFVDLLRPWIIEALKFSGGDYDNKDVQPYTDGSLTSKLADWMGQHWRGEC